MRSKETVWPSGLRRQFQVLVTCGVGSNPTTVTYLFSISHGTREREEKKTQQQHPPLPFSFFCSASISLASVITRHCRNRADRVKGFVIALQSEKVFYCSANRAREETSKVNNNISSRVAVGLFSR